eukprot:7268930-Pyramimonas_sp.AAC.1
MNEGVQAADAWVSSERVRVWRRWRERYSRGSVWGPSREDIWSLSIGRGSKDAAGGQTEVRSSRVML